MSEYVYLDWAATCPKVKYPCSAYGTFLNPNANYAYKEKRLLSEAEDRVKKAIGAKSGKVIFGGTSSQLIENLMNSINRRYTTISSIYEHDSFYRYGFNTAKNLEELPEFLPFPTYANSTFVLWQAVQNITGEIFPTKQIGELVHQYHGFYICDGTAQIGHTPIEPNIDGWCDFYVFSGHKLGTELGIGCCWISDRLDEWLNGFKLHGTPNLAGALALTQAAEDACDVKYLSVSTNRYNNLYDNLFYIFKKHSIDFQVIDGNIKTCAINAIRLPEFNARALQSYLASKEIYIGLGQSSCADEADRRVLCQGYGLSEQEADEVIRVSFGENSSVDEVKALIDGIVAFREEYL